MSNFEAKVRSNYFKVKSRKKFDEFLCRWTLRALAENEKTRLVGFTTEDMTDHGAIQNPEEDQQADFCAELAAQLKPGEVAIFMEVGSEKIRYLFGHATAVNSKVRLAQCHSRTSTRKHEN